MFVVDDDDGDECTHMEFTTYDLCYRDLTYTTCSHFRMLYTYNQNN